MNILEQLKSAYTVYQEKKRLATWREQVPTNRSPFVFKWSSDGSLLTVYMLRKGNLEEVGYLDRTNAQSLGNWICACTEEK